MTGSDSFDSKLQDECNLSKKPIVPELTKSIDRKNVLQKCLQSLTRTRLHNNTHKACVCVICDCFIIGTEKINWLSEEDLLRKEEYLSVQYLEHCVQKTIPDSLRDQYKITGNDNLDGLILSPRATVRDGMYMTLSLIHI